MAGRQTAEDFQTREESTDLVEAVILRSPTGQVQAANEEAEGSRADEGLEVSEKSAVCLPQEKNLNKVSFVPSSDLHKYIQQEGEGRKRWKRMRARALERGATDRGNKVGALVLVGV